MLGVALGARRSTRAGEWGRFGVVRPLLSLLAVAAIVPLVVVLAAGIHIRNSGDAVDAGNGARAKSEALAARAVEPWDAATWLQLALVESRLRQYDAAASTIRAAIRRAPRDYRLWVTAAEIDAFRGDLAAVHRDFAHVRRLNPYASILRGSS
jgi:predicted Zn-dependent protease